jgi:type IV pilus assembly protein PilE
MPSIAPPSIHRAAKRGFTMIELMIALVVIALLAAVAYPAYTDAIAKNRRAEGVAAIAAVQLAQERWRSNNDTYSSTYDATNKKFTDLNVSAQSGPEGYYLLSISDASDFGYTVTATAVSSKAQASDTNCVRLQIQVERAIVKYRSGAAAGALDDTNQYKCWSR